MSGRVLQAYNTEYPISCTRRVDNKHREGDERVSGRAGGENITVTHDNKRRRGRSGAESYLPGPG